MRLMEPYRDLETLAWMTGGDSLSRHPDVRALGDRQTPGAGSR